MKFDTKLTPSLSLEQYQLVRHPKNFDPSLKAWNSADQLLLNFYTQNIQQHSNENTLQNLNIGIINDQFGALGVALADHRPFIWCDSLLSKIALKKNLKKNGIAENIIDAIEARSLSLDMQKDDFKRPLILKSTKSLDNIQFDLLLIRVPKHNSLLAFQLQMLKPYIHNNTLIAAGGMTKEIHKSTLAIFESIIGDTHTSLAEKKARLIFAMPNAKKASTIDVTRYDYKPCRLTLKGFPGVFSRDSLDIGTRVLLSYLGEIPDNAKIVDLGCGTGVLGVIVAKNSPQSTVYCVDESALAVLNAEYNFYQNQLSNGRFVQSDVFRHTQVDTVDLILCNPPFHQQNVQTISIAKTMFKESAERLSSDGKLLVVANRHLKYGPILRKFFMQVKPISKDKQFIVWQAESPRRQ